MGRGGEVTPEHLGRVVVGGERSSEVVECFDRAHCEEFTWKLWITPTETPAFAGGMVGFPGEEADDGVDGERAGWGFEHVAEAFASVLDVELDGEIPDGDFDERARIGEEGVDTCTESFGGFVLGRFLGRRRHARGDDLGGGSHLRL